MLDFFFLVVLGCIVVFGRVLEFHTYIQYLILESILLTGCREPTLQNANVMVKFHIEQYTFAYRNLNIENVANYQCQLC